MRLAGQTYLPKFTNESKDDYDIRLKNAKFTNLFGDILSTLASKPFEQEMTVEKADAVKDLIEDIDGQGNHIQVFAGQAFYDGIANAIHWCLVDYTKDVPQGATIAAEKALGARPYWVHISAKNLLAVYSENVAGKETIVHARIRELGRQPLTAQSGNITTITAAFAGDKAHTVIEAWALNFKDFLENCLKITAMWKNTTIEPEVQINTDFSLALKEDTGVTSLDAAQERNALSWETWFMEMKRRGIIGPNVDKDEERKRILDEIPGDPSDEEIAASLPGTKTPADPVDA